MPSLLKWLTGDLCFEAARRGIENRDRRHVDASCGNESSELDLETGDHNNVSSGRTDVGHDLGTEGAYDRSMSSTPIRLTRDSASLCPNVDSLSSGCESDVVVPVGTS